MKNLSFIQPCVISNLHDFFFFLRWLWMRNRQLLSDFYGAWKLYSAFIVIVWKQANKQDSLKILLLCSTEEIKCHSVWNNKSKCFLVNSSFFATE